MKRVLIIILIFILIIISLFWFFNRNSNTDEKLKNNDSEWSINLNPFGEPVVNKKEERKNKENNKKFDLKDSFGKEEIPKLREIAKIPVAGVFLQYLTKKEIHEINIDKEIYNTELAWKFADKISEIRYISSRNGHIYRTYTNTLKTDEILNATIPRIYRAEFWNKNYPIIQYLDSNENLKTYIFYLREKTETEIEEEKKKNTYKENILAFSGRFLRDDNVEDFSLNRNLDKIFYLRKNPDDNSTDGIVEGVKGEDRARIFNSKMKELNIYWPKNSQNIFMINKASSSTYSVSFKLNSNNALFKKIYKGILAGNGLPNNDFSKIAYTAKDEKGVFRLYIYNLKTKEFKKVGALSTFIEKCSWASENNKDLYCAVPQVELRKNDLDLWYQGVKRTSDDIYKIDTDSLKSKIIFDQYIENKSFDIIKLKLDDFDKNLYFINQKDFHPWIYRMDNDENIIPEEKSEGKHEYLGGGQSCPKEDWLHENMKAGDRNGKYSAWAKKKITEVKKLQKHMNRLGFNAGKIDGILGPETDAAIKRMQVYLGFKGKLVDGLVGPLTRDKINHSCGE